MERLRGSALSSSLGPASSLRGDGRGAESQVKPSKGYATWLKPKSSCGKANPAPKVGGAGQWEELEEWEELGSGRRWKGVEGEEQKPRPKYVAHTSSVPDSVLFA